MLIEINSKNPQPRLINEVVNILQQGGIIAYPTDTYYGIGCDIFNKHAIQKIYWLKKQNPKKPFSFICSDLKHISRYAQVSNYAYKTMRRLLPGPYTFILRGSKMVPKIMITKRKTVGIRVPDSAICIALVNTFGNPILNTTATTPEEKTFFDPSLLHDFFGGQIDVVIDGGPVPGQPSSIISLIDDVPEVVREGLGDVSSFL
jgi:tRNA threonylcarbamoyl adenosine modification protein (Sua5/YciO/YrdC/YwlC family)